MNNEVSKAISCFACFFKTPYCKTHVFSNNTRHPITPMESVVIPQPKWFYAPINVKPQGGEAGYRRGIWCNKSARGRDFWSFVKSRGSVYPYFNSCLTNALTFFWRGGDGEFALFWPAITSLGSGIWTEKMIWVQIPRLCPASPPQQLNIDRCITELKKSDIE